MRRKLAIAVALFILTAGVVFAFSRISNSRTFQFFGEIVPRVETEEKIVALTFDDGPTPVFTDEILQILRDDDIKATFFLIGGAIAENRGEAKS